MRKMPSNGIKVDKVKTIIPIYARGLDLIEKKVIRKRSFETRSIATKLCDTIWHETIKRSTIYRT